MTVPQTRKILNQAGNKSIRSWEKALAIEKLFYQKGC